MNEGFFTISNMAILIVVIVIIIIAISIISKLRYKQNRIDVLLPQDNNHPGERNIQEFSLSKLIEIRIINGIHESRAYAQKFEENLIAKLASFDEFETSPEIIKEKQFLYEKLNFTEKYLEKYSVVDDNVAITEFDEFFSALKEIEKYEHIPALEIYSFLKGLSRIIEDGNFMVLIKYISEYKPPFENPTPTDAKMPLFFECLETIKKISNDNLTKFKGTKKEKQYAIEIFKRGCIDIGNKLIQNDISETNRSHPLPNMELQYLKNLVQKCLIF